MPFLKNVVSALVGIFALLLAAPAHADSPGVDAIDDFRETSKDVPAIENRFFLKGGRFEIAPMFGYVPNNPFAKRMVGSLAVGYHFNEEFSAQGVLSYSPDFKEGDLKGLTQALVIIAHTGPGGDDFQQPLDKITLSAGFVATWSPIYGKINLIGETVLNFDLYAVAGLGVISKVTYSAQYDDTSPRLVSLFGGTNEVKVSPTVGIGTNFFLNQTISLKLDARFGFYLDNKPQYDQTEQITQQRLYNNFVASAGFSFFFPRMKPRLYNF